MKAPQKPIHCEHTHTHMHMHMYVQTPPRKKKPSLVCWSEELAFLRKPNLYA